MGLRGLTKKLATPVEELDKKRLNDRFRQLGLIELGAVTPRLALRAGGEVVRMRVQPRSGVPSFEITLSDGTGTLVAVFTGRRRLAGLEQGRSLIVEGMPFVERGRLLVLNPAYTLL